MAKKKVRIYMDVEFEDSITNEEDICDTMTSLWDTANSTPGMWDDFGSVEFGEFALCPEYGVKTPYTDWRVGKKVQVIDRASAFAGRIGTVQEVREDGYLGMWDCTGVLVVDYGNGAKAILDAQAFSSV